MPGAPLLPRWLLALLIFPFVAAILVIAYASLRVPGFDPKQRRRDERREVSRMSGSWTGVCSGVKVNLSLYSNPTGRDNELAGTLFLSPDPSVDSGAGQDVRIRPQGLAMGKPRALQFWKTSSGAWQSTDLHLQVRYSEPNLDYTDVVSSHCRLIRAID
jgi:hypothetical protein